MREFLKGLELDPETIDTIMAEHGKLMTNLKEKNDSYKEEIASYKSQIGELTKAIDENKSSLENLQSMADENKNLKAELQLNNSNVKKEFIKFVSNEVSSKVNDDVDFAKALNDYKKENPQYFGDTVVKKVQSSPNLASGGQQPTTTNDIMNNILRGATNNE